MFSIHPSSSPSVPSLSWPCDLLRYSAPHSIPQSRPILVISHRWSWFFFFHFGISFLSFLSRPGKCGTLRPKTFLISRSPSLITLMVATTEQIKSDKRWTYLFSAFKLSQPKLPFIVIRFMQPVHKMSELKKKTLTTVMT